MRVYLPHCTNANDDGARGWAVLRGSTHPVTVVAFCWDHDCAKEIYEALGRQQGTGVFIAEAFLEDDRR